MNHTTQTPAEKSIHSVAMYGSSTLMGIAEPTAAAPERLMPYGAAAKVIFVKANGMQAYNDAVRCENLYCADDYEQTKPTAGVPVPPYASDKLFGSVA